MNSTFDSSGEQAAPSCMACDTPTGTRAGLAVVSTGGRTPAFICGDCYRHAQRSPQFRREVEIATAAGVRLSDIRRIFASLGVHQLPTTVDGFMAAVGLAPAGR